MIKEAIYHRAMSPFVYKYDRETIHIRFHTKRNDIQSVDLIWNDPYDWHSEDPAMWNFDPNKPSFWRTFETPMEKIGHDEQYDYWFIAIKPPFRRLRYGFRLHDGNETAVYTEKGWFEDKPLDDTGYYFCIPFINPVDIFHAPSWVKDTVWYQIFPDRFANGDDSLNPEGTLPWNSAEPTTTNFFGGDFQGIIDHIDHIVDLGITGIYFCPIFKATTNHKYDTLDYMEIDPQFGTKEQFKQLVDLLHENGIKVMLDAVFNHVGYNHPWFLDVVENGPQSDYRDWFYLRDFPIETSPKPNYDTFAFEKNMPKINTEHPALKAYLLEVARYWVEEFGIDGWRLDVANEVDHAFWRDFRKTVKEANPEAYILGEIWHDAQPWLQGDQFDAVMNYPFTNASLNYFALDRTTASEFRDELTRVEMMNTMNVNEVTFNLIDSHDTPRALTRAKGHKGKFKLLMTSMLTYTGSPCIYYGDEIGLEGEQDPGCRRCMPWDEAEEDRELFRYVQKLIRLRKEHPVLANSGSYRFNLVDDNDNALIIERGTKDETYLIYFNNSDSVSKLNPLGHTGSAYDLLRDRDVDSLEVELAPFSATILKMK